MSQATESARRAIKVRKAKREDDRLETDVNEINPDLYSVHGQLGGDPELRVTASGKYVANFSIAYDVREKQGSEWVSRGVMWVRVNVWGKLAENCNEYLSKGDRVVVIGTWNETEWDDKDTGEKRTGVEMNARDVGFSMMFADKNQRYATETPY
jgi:single stranded DNA-binding protein